MATSHSERVKLSTAVTTILRAPVSRKSIAGAGFYGGLTELSSHDHVEMGAGEPEVFTTPGPWRDAVTASGGALHAPGYSSSRKSLIGAGPSSKMLRGPGPGPSAGAGAGGANGGFRRNGIASAPDAPYTRITAAGADAAQGRLPLIGSSSRSGALWGTSPATSSSQSVSQNGRGPVALPSISRNCAKAAADGSPVVVSFAPSRTEPNARAMRHVASRPGRASGAGTDDSAASAGLPSCTSSTTGMGPMGANGGKSGGAGLMRNIRRLFGKDSSIDHEAVSRAAAAAANPSLDDTLRQDDTASSVGLSGSSAAELASKHQRAQERFNRLRSSLLLADATVVIHPGAGAGGTDAGGAVPPLSKQLPRFPEGGDRALRSGKSFTQKAMEDPECPMFKTAKQLVHMQDKLSYREDATWREKAVENAAMERPILMAEGWKI